MNTTERGPITRKRDISRLQSLAAWLMLIGSGLAGWLPAQSQELPVAAGKIAPVTVTLADGARLGCTIALPGKFRMDGPPAPLIISLHFGWRGQLPPQFGRGLLEQLIQPAFGKLGAILAAPDCPGDGWTDARGEAAVLQLLQFLKKAYPVDPRRVALAGYSLGGIGTWYLIARHPDLFSAGIVVSGATRPEWAAAITAVPLYVIHSRADTVLSYASLAPIVAETRRQNPGLVFVTVDGTTHYDTRGFLEPLRKAAPWLKKIWKPK